MVPFCHYQRATTRSILLAVGAGLAFGAYMALSDLVLYQSVLPYVWTRILRLSLWEQFAILIPQSALEEVVFRLLAVTTVAWAIAKFTGAKNMASWIAIVVVACVIYPFCYWRYVASLPPSLLTVAREILEHDTAGVLWGWLYWRHGLAASIVAHTSAHLSLQPLLAMMAMG